jgi:TonB family protein
MHTDQIRVAAHKACRAGVVIAGFMFAAIGLPAVAQPAPPAAANGPSEALQRQALSPFRFILQNASAPVRKPAAASPAAEPRKPAAVEQAALQPRLPAPAPQSPVAQPQAQPEAPTPVAVFAPKPPEPSPVPVVHRDIVPVQTDEPRLSAALLRERPSGVVKVSFEVYPDGSTAAVKIVSSSNRALNKPSLEAVSGWKFQPVDEVLTVETELDYHYQ